MLSTIWTILILIIKICDTHSYVFNFPLVNGITRLNAKGFGQNPPPGVPPEIWEQSKLTEYNKLSAEYAGNTNKRVFDDVVDFPSEFVIKVIAQNENNFMSDIINSVCEALFVNPDNVQLSFKETSGGKYISVTLKMNFESADDLYKAYDVIGQDQRVKYCI